MNDQQHAVKENIDIKIDRPLINQAELARRTGYSQAMVSLVLNGKRKNERLMQQILEILKNAAPNT